MNPTVIKAIFKRDFISYFSNPTGYVFIGVFVVLSSVAAFWPPEFFSNNLANLDQLSEWMPFILIIFIPAITMSIWAEERRQGTDELLLTLPASDFDVVLGKYKAGVTIFLVALLFSMFSIFLVFSYGLGSPDIGQFLTTYLGYFLVGMAMLGIGMVASFLTSNLTIGFIMGMLFNLPLALAGEADAITKYPALAQTIRQWSAAEQFGDFSRGVVTLSGVVYFVSIALVALYICMVLIGRRHWSGGEEGASLGWHFIGRTLCLLVIVGAANIFLSNNNAVRLDATEGRINSLADSSRKLIRELGDDDEVKPVKVDVFVSPTVPTEYAKQKRELLSTLEELKSISGGKVQVNVNQIEVFSQEATVAEQAYGIEPRQVVANVQGAQSQDEIFMGAAFTSGLDKVVIPFFDRGVPVEYELVRSIATVSQQKRRKVGVLKTDAPLMGGFTMQGPTEEARIITELKKQYDLIEVDPANPITEKFDVLLAVQPSSLSPDAMANFVALVKSGQPVAVFEDPMPGLIPGVPGTAQPKQPQGQMAMFGGGQPEPKGDINQLWDVLGVRMGGEEIIWQAWNPYPSAGAFWTPQWVFVDENNGAQNPFSPDDPISKGLGQVLFFYAGGLNNMNREDVDFINLAVTGDQTGVLPYAAIRAVGDSPRLSQMHRVTNKSYILAAHVRGNVIDDEELELDDKVTDEELAKAQEELDSGEAADGGKKKEKKEQVKFNAVVVADIDCLSDTFFEIRRVGEEEMFIDWRFQNVTFVLNVLDSLAGDDRFIALRKRSKNYRTLEQIEAETARYREASQEEVEKFQEDAAGQIAAANESYEKAIATIEGRGDLSAMEKQMMLEEANIRERRKRDVKIKRLEDDRDQQVRQNERELAANIRGVQRTYKMAAVLVPPILPILLAAWVFFHRRQQEKEGVSQSRLRYGSADDKKGAAA
ncbi:ABC-type uncharacterized transport system [Posidoniimonas polymericola]|uniref:ABC-type uncharacterized transport system n=1 Tax=Posidoniimonas polymericola TaxID=2528002 RepID=A0A5C5YRQ6_9BACT|nr:Gldg family protein [Posidoniimonas polymericola]TWT77538.1 ABC-type uncharacterized transport system [Posidoniimonas polymericola]